jgi:uncharacterized protein (TIGR03083 family)
MQLTKPELKAALIAERVQLLNLIENASHDQLQQPSLCAGWTNANVLGHIIGFELSGFDAFLLFFRIKALDDINEKQAQKYGNLPKDKYIRLLRHGLKRMLFLLRIVPDSLINKKFIPVRNGHLSIAQLMGDLAMDRAIHYLDIASPLGVSSKVTEPAAMNVAIKLVLSCIDLLNSKIPQKFYGRVLKLELTGLSSGTYYWRIGTDEITQKPREENEIILTAKGDTNDFLFTVTTRPTLLQKQMAGAGNSELEKIIRKSFKANALWES